MNPKETVRNAISNAETRLITIPWLREQTGISPGNLYSVLDGLVAENELACETLGETGPQIWFTTQTESTRDTFDDLHVSVFPGRDEIVVVNRTDSVKHILSRTAHIVDSHEESHLYKISKEDVWNAPHDTLGDYLSDVREIIGDIPHGMEQRIRTYWENSHKFILRTHPDGFNVLTGDANDIETIAKRKLDHNTHYTSFVSDEEMRITSGAAAGVKQTLYDAGYPVIDKRDIEPGSPLSIELDGITLRDYQIEWVNEFVERGSGTFVGPPGSGKTVAAIGCIVEMGGETLIVVPSRELANQWESELLDKTTISKYKIGQYHGGQKNIKPITIATYDTARMSRHRKLFNEREWGLAIFDECQHTPAPVWKRTTQIQSKARLGLTATPVRESGSAKDIYTLLGPPVGTDWGRLFDDQVVNSPTVSIEPVSWDTDTSQQQYYQKDGHDKRQYASMNPAKIDKIESLLTQHTGETVLIFVEWVDQGKKYEDALGIPFIHGETPHTTREEYFEALRTGERDSLIISRIGDEGIDIPNVDVCIITSTLGSSKRQTAQRIGRVMRPQGNARGYLIPTIGTNEEEFMKNSTQYLEQQGIDITY